MRLLLFATLGLAAPAFACPGAAAADAAANCASKAELVGSACSYATGSMAQRVLLDGADFAYSGVLAPAKKKVIAEVAVPFMVADGVAVVANGILDAVTDTKAGLDFRGKLLEVDGVRFFVITEAKPRTS